MTSVLTVIGLLLGHYVSDGVLRGTGQSTMDDLWHTYNDSEVMLTSRTLVCKKRQRSAYILFYERQVRVQRRLILKSMCSFYVKLIRCPGHFFHTELKNEIFFDCFMLSSFPMQQPIWINSSRVQINFDPEPAICPTTTWSWHYCACLSTSTIVAI